ncbi:MAG: RusA family crossover junction endodeoxyribonuclease [Oceanospirillaceae bacterium]|nr:RusA family crossover junction endodeoxyribonuclease [Oceanospirillaceae bacterium]
MRSITITLDINPVAKQSVRSGNNGRYYQPKKYKDLEWLIRYQVAQQLPKDFEPFMNWACVDSVCYIHPPTKAQLKHKGKSRWLGIGGLIPKTTRPDVMDNLNKLPLDCLSDKKDGSAFVYKDDALIQQCNHISKWHGLNPRIELTLIGY